jgi:hypothetical protein
MPFGNVQLRTKFPKTELWGSAKRVSSAIERALSLGCAGTSLTGHCEYSATGRELVSMPYSSENGR